MRLTVYSDYSLRMLIYLAVRRDRLATISEVADAYKISRAHLMKIAHELGRAGVIATVRGRQGGLRLAKEPADIVLGDVIRLTEPDMALVPCFTPLNEPCSILPACVLKRALGEAGAAFLDVLDGYTLADLVRPSAQLRRLLDIPKVEQKSTIDSRSLES
jgi:Rrf2 family nitric oxide-sensitive transcriptional repressor